MIATFDLFSIESLAFDIANVAICFLLIFVLFSGLMLNFKTAVILLSTSFLPFVTNGVLFDPLYMPDQYVYFGLVKDIRNFDLTNFADKSPTVSSAAAILSVVPVPFIESVRSIGIINRFLYVIFLFYMLKRGFLNRFALYFYLLYPSLLLYSSLSLRDMLIAIFMVLGFIYIINRRVFISFIVSMPLLLIKPQNFAIQLFFLLCYMIFSEWGCIFKKPKLVLMFIAVSSMIVAFFLNLEYLQYYRAAMYAEDGGDPMLIEDIGTGLGLLTNGISSGLYFLLKPFPWEAINLLQLIQSVETLFVTFFLFWVTAKCYFSNRSKTIFWVFFLLVSSTIYGLVVFNYGTASRYRFPLVLTFVVVMTYEILQKSSDSNI